MKKIKEVGIFPTSCETGHYFVPYKDPDREDNHTGYYKRNANGKVVDTDKVYSMLYCTKCGETKEIIIVNRRR